jgi:hypothetical protein
MGTRRQARYTLVGRPPLRAEWESARGAVTTAADLLDLSRGGAKLVLDDSPGIGAELTLHFDHLACAVRSTVCWSRVDENERSWLACAFDPPLPEDVLEALLREGYLERRRDPREPVKIPAMARWPMGDPVAVDVRDFSAGGLCLTAPHAAERGQRMLLHLGDDNGTPASAMVEVQWCIRFDDGYLIGCSFLHREGLAAVRRMAPNAAQDVDDSAQPARGLRGGLEGLKAAWKSIAAWADRDR